MRNFISHPDKKSMAHLSQKDIVLCSTSIAREHIQKMTSGVWKGDDSEVY